MLYLFIYCWLVLAPVCHTLPPAGSTTGNHHSPKASAEKEDHVLLRLHRTVYLHFSIRADPAPPGSTHSHVPMPGVHAAVLLTDEAGEVYTTTGLTIGKVPDHGNLPRLNGAVMFSRLGRIPSVILSRLGTPLQSDAGVTSVTFKLGTTTIRNIDIIHPQTGAGVWLNTLENNPRISPTNLYSSIILKLIDHLNIIPDHHGGSALGALTAAEFNLIRYCFDKMNRYQLARNIFSTFPVMVLIHRQPVQADVYYNIADLRNPRLIPASPHNHLVLSVLQQLVGDPRYSGAGFSGEVVPLAGGGQVIRHPVLHPGRFHAAGAQSYEEDDMRSDDSANGSATGRQYAKVPQLGRSHSY